MDHTTDMVRVYNTSKSSCLGEQIELADSSLRRMVGLLGRASLAKGCGLLILPSQAIHTVGMAFPIDVLFVDKKYSVVGVREAIPPFRMTRVFWKALGVLELPAGTIRDSRTQLGDQLKVDFPS
ncbi:MAG: DUF192 domain-containing protein [Candidatus Korobacteraceae bacterium]